MNYKVLYRKYRPDSFSGLIGQEHVVSILKNSIKENKIAHAYLFSGPRGTGKTSTARILAKAVNCLENKDGLACNKCSSCLSFNDNPDIIEIDAASNNGVDEIRELINNIKIMPTSLKYKVYIIDEVHMLSQSAFNALLLTLEEPPEHVIFILATTNIESVPITILSRCQRFDFKRINDNNILNLLQDICTKEEIKYTDDGLKEIAALSDGGLRDALSILDQISKNGEEITSDLVSKEIGSISNKKIEDLIKNLDSKNVAAIDQIFNELQNTNLNYKVVIKKIIYYLGDVAVKILNNDDKWHLSFDDCKHLIMDLNDLLNKININVDPYLLIKITFLEYARVSTSQYLEPQKNGNVSLANTNSGYQSSEALPTDINISEMMHNVKNEDSMQKKNNDSSKKVSKKKNESNVINNLVDIRINNCFVGASKQFLGEIKENWNSFIANVDEAIIKGLVSDTYAVTASDKYAIIVTSIPHKELEINDNLKNIEKLFNSFYHKEYLLIFIGEEKWQDEKQKYINNLKNNYEYTYILETKEESCEKDEISEVADVFDIEKIEVQ